MSATQSEPPYSSASPSSVILVIIIIALSIVVLACIYLLLHCLSHRFHRTSRTFSVVDDIIASTQSSNQPQRQATSNNLLRSLPLFNFRSVKGNLTGADCAVCLSKFEPPDQLRLLPLCCHAFHAECIDTWIVSNGTCPLCRSPVVASETNVFGKMPTTENRGSGSFRIELGSVSRRRGGGAAEAVREPTQSSYSLGSLDYVMSENGYEVLIGEISAADKEFSIGIPIPEPPGEALTAEVAGGRSWLRDYVDSLVSVSFSSSFRSSGRFFSGSSRRTDSIVGVEDLETNRAGEEITEIFRWLSGI